jgi:hypothetical protein
MAREKDINRLEREIRGKMLQIKGKKVEPKDSGIGRLINLMKEFDEPLHDKILVEYKKLLDTIKSDEK